MSDTLESRIKQKAAELALEHNQPHIRDVIAKALQQQAAESLIDYKPNECRQWLAELFWEGTKGYNQMTLEELVADATKRIREDMEDDDFYEGETPLEQEIEAVEDLFGSFSPKPWGTVPEGEED